MFIQLVTAEFQVVLLAIQLGRNTLLGRLDGFAQCLLFLLQLGKHFVLGVDMNLEFVFEYLDLVFENIVLQFEVFAMFGHL